MQSVDCNGVKLTDTGLLKGGKIFFGDESRFKIWQFDGHVWVWWMPGERFLGDLILPTVKFSGDSIMVRKWFLWFDLGLLVPVVKNMNSMIYVDILDNAAVPALLQYFGKSPFFSSRITAPFTYRDFCSHGL